MFAFVFYACVTYYHKLSSLRQHPFISSQSVGWKSHGKTGFSTQGIRAEIKASAGMSFHFEVLGKNFQIHFHSWQNSVPCSCGTEVPVFLLKFSQGLLSALRSSWHSLLCDPLHFQVGKNLFHVSIFKLTSRIFFMFLI